jgi:hypothetical protein
MKYINVYAAGYIDGDGCFYLGKTIQKHNQVVVYEYSIQAVSVKKPVLDIFATEFGGYVRQKPDRANHKPAYCWTIKTTKSLEFALNIQPFLIDKKEQCRIYIELASSIVCNQFKKVEQKEIERREDLINKSRKDKHMDNFVTEEKVAALKNKAKTITINTELDYPYMAGLMDSEGCFRIKHWKPKNRPNEVYNITIEIGNTKYPILEWLVERFGGSVCFIQAKKNKKASATWTLSAAALFAILPKIRPYLISKQEVCDKLIEFQQTILPNGGDRHSELFRALFERRKEIRDRIIAEVHEFNLKGSH